LPRVFLLGKKLAVEIPSDIARHHGISEGQELTFSSKDAGSVIVSVEKRGAFSRNSVLNELLEIPFEKRSVKAVLEKFSREKRKIFAELVKEDKVILSNKTYRVPLSVVKSAGARAMHGNLGDSFRYLVIKEEAEARKVSDGLSEEILSGKIIGVRGFDSNFYVVGLDVFKEVSSKISGAINEGIADFDSLSKKVGDRNLLKAVIEVMKDKGMVVEKRNGLFVVV